jgi:hypothetical protein
MFLISTNGSNGYGCGGLISHLRQKCGSDAGIQKAIPGKYTRAFDVSFISFFQEEIKFALTFADSGCSKVFQFDGSMGSARRRSQSDYDGCRQLSTL